MNCHDLFLLLNADDLGLDKHVNRETFAFMDKGKITSASLLMNGDSVEEAVHTLFQYPQCSFGIHLNCSSGKPLSGHVGLSPLLDDEGAMQHRLNNQLVNRELCTAIYHEWKTQVRKARQMGVPISHVDSHYHIHTIPRLFRVLLMVLKEENIHRVRLTKNLYAERDYPGVLIFYSKHIWNHCLKLAGRIKSTDCFTEFSTLFQIADDQKLIGKRIELMLHPGSQLQEFQEEIKRLKTEWQESIPWNIRFISYNDV